MYIETMHGIISKEYKTITSNKMYREAVLLLSQ